MMVSHRLLKGHINAEHDVRGFDGNLSMVIGNLYFAILHVNGQEVSRLNAESNHLFIMNPNEYTPGDQMVPMLTL